MILSKPSLICTFPPPHCHPHPQLFPSPEEKSTGQARQERKLRFPRVLKLMERAYIVLRTLQNIHTYMDDGAM